MMAQNNYNWTWTQKDFGASDKHFLTKTNCNGTTNNNNDIVNNNNSMNKKKNDEMKNIGSLKECLKYYIDHT